jgi:hypothetical protein
MDLDRLSGILQEHMLRLELALDAHAERIEKAMARDDVQMEVFNGLEVGEALKYDPMGEGRERPVIVNNHAITVLDPGRIKRVLGEHYPPNTVNTGKLEP